MCVLSGVDFRFMFQHILTLFNFHLGLPELINEVNHQIPPNLY
jgi:hypothetical protein